MTTHFGEMAAENVRTAADGIVGFVDCVSAQNYRVAANPCLGIDDCIATDN